MTDELTDLEMVIALYQQGRSAREVGRIMGLTAPAVNKLVREAGVIRTPQEANRLSSHRTVARNKIAGLNIVRLAEQWLDGAEVEDLAAELDVPPDLLWDALAAHLSTRGGVTHPSKLQCAGTCTYGCTEQCAITTPVHNRAKVPGTPRSSRQGQREGTPYVRTGLNLPHRGQHSRWE